MSARLKDEGRLRAMGRFKSRRMEKSKRESERDSGFSDGSAVDQTDADDDSRPQLTAVVGGALQGLQPMIIMNNVVLKQPGESSASVKPWFSPAVEVLQQPQVVFLQPVVPQRGASVPKAPASKRRRHKKYLPILKSYPRIAPHPHKSSGSSTSSSSSVSSIKSSSSCHSDRRRTDATQPLPQNTPAEADSDERRPESPEPTLAPHSPSDADNKTKRFCNTYNILSKSGLLDITLRTKELIRQNRRTQTELERLRKDTNLFMEALQTGDSEAWRRLQSGMQEDEEKGKHRTVSDGENRDQ